MNRVCNVCKQELAIECFAKDASKTLGHAYRCKECDRTKSNAYKKKHRRNKPEWRKAANRRREYVNNIKRERGCKYCDEKEIVCLDFHHLDPSKKKYAINRMVEKDCSLVAIDAEIAKCICVCSNCHRKIHAGILTPHPPEMAV